MTDIKILEIQEIFERDLSKKDKDVSSSGIKNLIIDDNLGSCHVLNKVNPTQKDLEIAATAAKQLIKTFRKALKVKR